MSYISEEELDSIERSLKRSFDIFNIWFNNLINSISIFILKNSLLYYQNFKDKFIDCKTRFIKNYLDETIYQIDYIDIKKNEVLNIYYSNFLFRFISILFYNINPYFIRTNTIINISETININNDGYLNITYYSDCEEKNSLINIKNFKRENNNYLFKSVDLLITNIITNFILNTTLVKNEDLTYVELVFQNSNINITDIFRKYKNSFKEDNINLLDLLVILGCLINNKEIEHNSMNDMKLLITDSNLDDKVFTINENINFKTLYQELSENNKDNLD
mgnify:FL=1